MLSYNLYKLYIDSLKLPLVEAQNFREVCYETLPVNGILYTCVPLPLFVEAYYVYI